MQHSDLQREFVLVRAEVMMLAPSQDVVPRDLKTLQDFGFGGRWKRYAQSKLADALYASQLAKHYPSLASIAVHPVVLGTELVSGLSFADQFSGLHNVESDHARGWLQEFIVGGHSIARLLQKWRLLLTEPSKRTKFSHHEKLAERRWSGRRKLCSFTP